MYNSTDIFDEPVTELLVDFEGHLQMQYMFDENEILHIVVFKSNVENVNVKKNNLSGDVGDDNLSGNISKIMDYIVDAFRPDFSNIKGPVHY